MKKNKTCLNSYGFTLRFHGLVTVTKCGRIKTFCAAAVLAPCEDRHTSSPSDCFRRYHSDFASTRRLRLWLLNATSWSFLRLWLHPGRLAPDHSLSCLTSFIGLHSDDLWMGRGFEPPWRFPRSFPIISRCVSP